MCIGFSIYFITAVHAANATYNNRADGVESTEYVSICVYNMLYFNRAEQQRESRGCSQAAEQRYMDMYETNEVSTANIAAAHCVADSS